MSTDTEQKPATLAVVEEKDGSAVVQLPDDVQSPDGETDDEGSADDAQAAASGDEDAGGDDDRPGDTDAVREARRNRRKAKKEYIRRTNEEKDQRLALLQRQNQELMERLSVVERKTHSSDLARLDKAIEDEELRYQYFEVKKREAINNSDGDAFNKAQEGWYEARRKIEAMRAIKQKAVETTPQDSGAVNPKLVRHANAWMERNSWYNPNGNDEDTQIAKVVDKRMVEEGWDPATPEYWDELDNRLQKRLPHCYNIDTESPRRSRPKSFVTGSSRESSNESSGSGRNTFTLAPEQVRAMKEAGFWDDPEKRSRMIKRYAQEARNRG